GAAVEGDGARDWVLIAPATLALLVLAEPTVALLFEHGRFTARDTFWTAWALRLYLAGLVFAAIDWPLNYAFYARQNTLTPALVGVLSVGVYLATALALIRPWGMLGLVVADSAKHMSHAATMLTLSHRQTHILDRRLGITVGKATLAAGSMAGVMGLAVQACRRWVGSSGLWERLILVVVPGGLGFLTYLGLAWLLRVGEVELLRTLIQRRFRRANLD
ncbi:MAG: lipid II flippase MurJ, partial [Candidatus Zipacnadales bacterium]